MSGYVPTPVPFYQAQVPGSVNHQGQVLGLVGRHVFAFSSSRSCGPQSGWCDSSAERVVLKGRRLDLGRKAGPTLGGVSWGLTPPGRSSGDGQSLAPPPAPAHPTEKCCSCRWSSQPEETNTYEPAGVFDFRMPKDWDVQLEDFSSVQDHPVPGEAQESLYD